MNWIKKHGTLNFTAAHMNDVLLETKEYFRLLSTSVAKVAFNKKHLLPPYPTYQDRNPQDCLAATKMTKIHK